MQYEIFGGPRVFRDGTPVVLGGRMSHRLLAALLLDAPRPVNRDMLIERLWDDCPPATATTSLQVHVSHLRRALEPDRRGEECCVLRTTGEGYALEADRSEIDADRYESLVHEAEQLPTTDPERAFGLIESARALWRDRPWGAFADEPWLRADAARVEELHRRAEELWADIQLSLGRHQLIVDSLAMSVEEEPLRERRWEQLIVARYRCGRQAEALRAFQDARRTLTDELGIEPSPTLRAIEQAVLDQDPSLDAPRPPCPQRPRHNLPVALTTLVGRDDDVRRTRKLLETYRLVTITGTAGCGKTRLAIAVAEGLVDRYQDGVWFISLANAGSADVVATQIASDLGLRESDEHGIQGPMALLHAFLRDRELLVVLDNCEHVAAEVASIVGALLASCPHLRVVATSRAVIGLVGETIEAISPLDTPAAHAAPEEVASSSAVKLFLERAADTGSFDETTEELATIGELCRFLDGVPLAIELAAMWAAVLAPRDILDRLESRLSLVATDERLPERQRALRTTIEWSHALLTDAERAAFRRLSVFSAGFTLAGAQAVIAGDDGATDSVIGTIARLVSSSLVRTDHRSNPARYRMLEAVREYAAEQLGDVGEEGEIRARQLDYFVRLARAVRSGELFGPPVGEKMAALDCEHDNVRAMLEQLLADQDGERAVLLAGTMGTYWFERGHWGEGQRWLTRALELGSGPCSLDRARALTALAQTAGSFAGIAARVDELEESVEIFRHYDAHQPLAVALLYLSIARAWRHEFPLMRTASIETKRIAASLDSRWIDTTIAVYENLALVLEGDLQTAHSGLVNGAAALLELGDDPLAARTFMYAANVSRLLGDLTSARNELERTMELALTRGVPGTHAHGLLALAQVAMERGDADAPSLFLDCLAALELIGDSRCIAICQRSIGSLALDAGRADEALDWLRQSLEALAAHDRRALSVAIADLATIYQRRGMGTEAARLVAAAQALAQQSGMPLTASERDRIEAAAVAIGVGGSTPSTVQNNRAVDLGEILQVARRH